MTNRRKLVAANWKMNGSHTANAAWLSAFSGKTFACDVVVCPPFVYLSELKGQGFELGAQNLSQHALGAYTGEVAGEMLLDAGCRWAIVGHSERRQLFGESNELVAEKAARALALGLRPMVCIGETLAEREAGQTLQVVGSQLGAILHKCSAAQLVNGAIAYEPVWAIGTGKTATPAQAQEVHAAIRQLLANSDRKAADQVRVLYGGSVKPANAAELFRQPDIDGGLIGGASLIAEDFAAICAAAV